MSYDYPYKKELPNGKALLIDKIKYGSYLTFIVPQDMEYIKYTQVFRRPCYDCNDIKMIAGKFWINKKGTACFQPMDLDEAPHVLLNASWGGGCCNFTKAKYLDDVLNGNTLYEKCSSSKWGGVGHSYYVITREVFERLL